MALDRRSPCGPCDLSPGPPTAARSEAFDDQQPGDGVEIVVTFLALLELVKRYRVTAKQDVLFGAIEFERSEEWKDDEEIEIEFE